MTKLVKWSKLNNSTLRRLLDALVLGVPAIQAAKFAQVHRNTANKLYKRLRINIALLSDQQASNKLIGEIELDESYFGGKRKGNRGRGADNKQIVFGILERSGQVRTVVVEDVSAATLMKQIQENTEKGCVYYTDKFKSYNSLDRYGKHLQIDHAKHFRSTRNHHNHINGIEGFWSYAKKFLVKYNGVGKNNFPLYLKEIEWRYNHRHNTNLFEEIKRFL